jgi:hypothetical protein
MAIKISCPKRINCTKEGFEIVVLGIAIVKVPWDGIHQVESTTKGWKLQRGTVVRYRFYYEGAFLGRPMMLDFNQYDSQKVDDFWSVFSDKTGGLKVLKK